MTHRIGTITLGVLFAAAMLPGTAQASSLPAATSPLHWGQFTGNASSPAPKVLTPASVTIPDSSPVAEVGSSNSTDYALLADGTVWGWGQGNNGQLGNGGTAGSATPVQVQFPPGVSIAFLATDAMPFNGALVVDASGNAWGWGANTNGDLCLGNKNQVLSPVQLPLTSVTSLAGASGHSIFASGGSVYTCGGNGSGTSGTGHNSMVPVQVPGLAGIASVYASYQNDGALSASGAYYDWGLNAEGQVGNGTTANAPAPVQVSLPAPVVQVALGGSLSTNGQTMALLAAGQLWGWGNGSYGQLPGSPSAQTTPVQVPEPAAVTFTAMASAGGSVYGLDSTGAVWAWGEGDHGELGDGGTANSATPIEILTGATHISATARNAVAG